MTDAPPSGFTADPVDPHPASYVDRDPAHQHGHTFRITVESQGHYCTRGPDGTCTEPEARAEWWGRLNTVEVRGSSLHDALTRARDLPFGAWVEAPEEEADRDR